MTATTAQVAPGPPVRFPAGVTDLLSPIGDVKPADRNPNNGDVDAICESIVINGFQVPVIARRDTGEIVAGNHRYYALLRLGATQVPVIWTDMDDTAASRFLIADNRLARLGRDDPAQLLEILREVQSATPIGLAGTGYDTEFIDYLTDVIGGPLDLSLEDDRDLEAEASEFARQRARSLTCPECGHEFTPGGHR
jgi:hypothetical protein